MAEAGKMVGMIAKTVLKKEEEEGDRYLAVWSLSDLIHLYCIFYATRSP